jgi:hypothetical protein
VGRYDLGLNETEFWRLTMRLYLGLCKRLQFDRQQADLRAGQLAALLSNLLAVHEAGTPFAEPADFFPSLPRFDGSRVLVQRVNAQPGASERMPDGEIPKPQTIEEIDMGPDYDPMALLAKVARINLALGGRDLRGQQPAATAS